MLNQIRVSFKLILISILLFCCATNNENISSPELSYEDMYRNAIIDAMVAEEEEIYNNLISIVETNEYLSWSGSGFEKRVLVLTWTEYPNSYPVGDTILTWWGETWVTVVPEIKHWFDTEYISENKIETRLKQLLGLPIDDTNTHFIELWVRPDALFRPSPDNEITDNVASLDFPTTVEDWYREWYDVTTIRSYFPLRYPWTRLGYTYDWSNSANEIGVSEFVIKKDSKVIVESKYPTLIYLSN